MAKVIVLGVTGMLGHEVVSTLVEHGHEVHASFRDPTNLNALRKRGIKNFFTFNSDQNHAIAYILPDADYVINCIGAIKQRTNDPEILKHINSELPYKLAVACNDTGTRLIHVTTDCVFSGKTGWYTENHVRDATDDYGFSKLCGEPGSCMNIRTSIVGFELDSAYSLLSWACSQRGKRVEGYKNHLWNGVTNREFGHIVHRIIDNDLYCEGTRHVFSESSLTKCQMMMMFNQIFDLSLNVVPIEHGTCINRTLSTVFDLNWKLNVPPFYSQLKELRDATKVT